MDFLVSQHPFVTLKTRGSAGPETVKWKMRKIADIEPVVFIGSGGLRLEGLPISDLCHHIVLSFK